MTIHQVLVLLALTLYAVYRQSVRHEVSGRSRFKLAMIYAIVGLVVGGYHVPPDAASWTALGASLLASVLVGLVRGRCTRLYSMPDGRVFSQGTPFTVGLFLLLVGAKFGLGTWQYLHGNHPHGGFGEVLLMIAAMAAMQAEIVWRRVQALAPAAAPALAARP